MDEPDSVARQAPSVPERADGAHPSATPVTASVTEVIPPDPAPRPPSYIWLAPLAPRELPKNPFWPPPILGSLALIFGLNALFQAPLVFGPLGALFGLLALLRGQFWFAGVGGLTALAALAASPTFWALIGVGWVVGYWIL